VTVKSKKAKERICECLKSCGKVVSESLEERKCNWKLETKALWNLFLRYDHLPVPKSETHSLSVHAKRIHGEMAVFFKPGRKTTPDTWACWHPADLHLL
jgi:hypothetical protein